MNMILRALMVSVWFMALTFPLVVLKVDALNDTILFRWENMASIGVGAFVLSIFWRWSMERKARGAVSTGPSLFARALEAVRQPKPRYTCLGLIAVLMLVMPYISSMYQINIMISALIYIMLGLGLNIVVGLAGQLVLGYAAFYAVGAYTYGLLNTYFGLGFWAVLPVGGIMAALFGLMLGFPVLRLKGDYLAIVTLGFGEIIRLVLENWTSVTKGSFGLSNLSRPSLFGMEMGVTEATNYIYYIVLAAVVVTIIVVGRLKNSRIGLALQALREDEIACEAMGIDLFKHKQMSFVISSFFAGVSGALLAMYQTTVQASAFKSAMTSKLNAGEIIVVDEIKLAEPKTKLMAKVLGNFDLKGWTMLVLPGRDETLVRASGNIEKLQTSYVNTLNVYDILKAGKIILTKDALKGVEEVYA